MLARDPRYAAIFNQIASYSSRPAIPHANSYRCSYIDLLGLTLPREKKKKKKTRNPKWKFPPTRIIVINLMEAGGQTGGEKAHLRHSVFPAATSRAADKSRFTATVVVSGDVTFCGDKREGVLRSSESGSRNARLTMTAGHESRPLSSISSLVGRPQALKDRLNGQSSPL